VVQECIDEGAGGMTRCWVDDQPRGLIKDDDIVIFVNDVERNVFRAKDVFYRRRDVDLNALAGGYLEGGAADDTIDGDVARLDELMQVRSAEVRDVPGNEFVQPFIAVLGGRTETNWLRCGIVIDYVVVT
jgi:hypothetical protein